MIQKKDKRKENGGHKTAGRKSYKDPKIKKAPVQVYIKQSEIDLLGGITEARVISLTALEKQIKNKIKK